MIRFAWHDGESGEGFTMGRYHFISGLPRSGSTLLAAILRQNPRYVPA